MAFGVGYKSEHHAKTRVRNQTRDSRGTVVVELWAGFLQWILRSHSRHPEMDAAASQSLLVLFYFQIKTAFMRF
jgi:hypothetical protein